MIPILAFLAKPLVKFGLPVLVLSLMALTIWIQGQRLHSAKVERDAAVTQVKAYEKAWAARNDADLKAVTREKDYDASKDVIGVPNDPRIYLCRLRAVQTGADPATACK